jgi:predicted transcriptional regulator
MKSETEDILTLLDDGTQRSFDEIQASTGLDSVDLQNDLRRLADDGLIEQTVISDDDLYMITAKGLEAASGVHA